MYIYIYIYRKICLDWNRTVIWKSKIRSLSPLNKISKHKAKFLWVDETDSLLQRGLACYPACFVSLAPKIDIKSCDSLAAFSVLMSVNILIPTYVNHIWRIIIISYCLLYVLLFNVHGKCPIVRLERNVSPSASSMYTSTWIKTACIFAIKVLQNMIRAESLTRIVGLNSQ